MKDTIRVPCIECRTVLPGRLLLIPTHMEDVGPWCRHCYDSLVALWRHQANRAFQMARRLPSVYGITIEDYGAMFVAQAGRCAICRDPQGERPLVVDHDHATGAVRSLLCSNCNAGIGLLKERSEVLTSAIGYLERHS